MKREYVMRMEDYVKEKIRAVKSTQSDCCKKNNGKKNGSNPVQA